MKKLQIEIPCEMWETMLEYEKLTEINLDTQIRIALIPHLGFFMENKALYELGED